MPHLRKMRRDFVSVTIPREASAGDTVAVENPHMPGKKFQVTVEGGSAAHDKVRGPGPKEMMVSVPDG